MSSGHSSPMIGKELKELGETLILMLLQIAECRSARSPFQEQDHMRGMRAPTCMNMGDCGAT